MDKKNRGIKCYQCDICEPSQVVLEPCSSTQNTDCGCVAGKYFDASYLYACLVRMLLICIVLCGKHVKDQNTVSCAECGKGYGVETPCKGSQNTVCQPCGKVCI